MRSKGLILLGLLYTSQAVQYDSSCNTPEVYGVIRRAFSEAKEMSLFAQERLDAFFEKPKDEPLVHNYLRQFFGWKRSPRKDQPEDPEITAINKANRKKIQEKLEEYFYFVSNGFDSEEILVYCNANHFLRRPSFEGQAFSKECAVSDCTPNDCGDEITTALCVAAPKDRYMVKINGINWFFPPGTQGCEEGDLGFSYGIPGAGYAHGFIVTCPLAYNSGMQSIKDQRNIYHAEGTDLDRFSGLSATVLHEMTHTRFGSRTTDEYHDGVKAYGYVICLRMAEEGHVDKALRNADTFTYFALALYLQENYWYIGKALPRARGATRSKRDLWVGRRLSRAKHFSRSKTSYLEALRPDAN